MNKVIYYFVIEAVSPLYFGTEQDGQERKLIRNSEGRAGIPGNSIGGALREYLKQTELSEETIWKYMGGSKPGEDGREEFITSGIYISDGKIAEESVYCRKEGTAINPTYGTAERHQKYSLEYLPEGTEIFFQIEGDIRDDKGQDSTRQEKELCADELEKIVCTWAQGFAAQTLLLGGQKSNGFGRFRLKKLEKTVFVLNNSKSLDDYIFCRKDQKETVCWRNLDFYRLANRSTIVFSMTGEFPYGVYQAFPIKESSNTGEDFPDKRQLTGLQKKGDDFFIPSTSLKGLVKNQIRLLLKRITGEECVSEKLNELFGGENGPGKLTFFDLLIKDSQPVYVERYVKHGQREWRNEKSGPVYIKIDRLTGNAYASALKQQQEIQGNAEICFKLSADQSGDDLEPYLFPLVYVLRRIGAGIVPLGGRTVIGLGQFFAQKIKITIDDKAYIVETGDELQEDINLLEEWFESFKKGWCKDENTSDL